MKEAKFIALNREKWNRIEQQRRDSAEMLALNYTELCDDLAYARTFYPGSDTERYLNRLLIGYQENIGNGRMGRTSPVLSFWTKDFPGLIVSYRKTLLFALIFFLFSALVGAFSAAHDSMFVRLILGDAYVDQTLDNIRNGTPMGIYNSQEEWSMFFAITFNNIKVSFIAFVFGLLFSGGTLWVLFSNGIMLGAFQYFFYQHGLLFHSALSVWAHGTFEITAIIIAGGAGLVMGNSFLFPGTYPRLLSFQRGAREGIRIVTGLIPFFVIAGFIESFITRHADAYPVVGLLVIILSVAGILVYFVIYPYRLFVKSKIQELHAENELK